MSIFTIPYSITDNDFLAFNDHFLQNTALGRRTLLSYRLIAPVLSIFALLVFWITDQDSSFIIAELIALTIGSIICWVCARRRALNSLRKRLQKQNSVEKTMFNRNGQLVFDFENKIIIDIADRTEFKIPFEKIEICYQTADAFYFYFAPNKAFILPYRLFQNAGEFTEFKNLVRLTFPSIITVNNKITQ